MGGEAAGIGALTAGEPDSPLATGVLSFRGVAAESPSPTWLAAHPRQEVVYAAQEGAGRVAVFRRTGEESLEPLGEGVEAGEAVCHLAVAPDGSRLIASCWGDGRVVEIPLRSDGTLASARVAPSARDPYDGVDHAQEGAAVFAASGSAPASSLTQGERTALALRTEPAGGESRAGLVLPGAAAPDVAEILAASQRMDETIEQTLARRLAEARDTGEDAPVPDEADETATGDEAARPSRAHGSCFLPGQRIATTDLGFDLVRIWRIGPSGLVPDHEVVLPYGTGPRHLFLHPSGHLQVITEFSCEIFTLVEVEGLWRLHAATPTGALTGDTGAELTASRDMRFLYAGLRGSDTISVLRVDDNGSTLRPVALAESGVVTPWYHRVVRDALLIAGQGSNEIVSLRLDERTGVPSRPAHRVEHPTPHHLLPVR